MFWLFSFPVISFFQTFYALRDASVQMSVHYHPLAVFGTDECLVLVSCAGLDTPAPALVLCIYGIPRPSTSTLPPPTTPSSPLSSLPPLSSSNSMAGLFAYIKCHRCIPSHGCTMDLWIYWNPTHFFLLTILLLLSIITKPLYNGNSMSLSLQKLSGC